MQLKVIVIENNREEMKHIIQVLQIWAASQGVGLLISTYISGEELFADELAGILEVELFILDIQLDGMNGMEIAKILREKKYDGNIVFLTAFREYVFEGYQVHALNYLMKPVSAEQLTSTLTELLRITASENYVFSIHNTKMQIPYREISAFSVNRHYIDITTINGETYGQSANLRDILPILPKEFIQCHRSYIVNMTHIQALSRTTICLTNKLRVPIGRSYLEKTRTDFSDYLLRFH
jgi:DNA-binding LytR/AlgR family response regulator